jgi:chromosome segregation ATPase
VRVAEQRAKEALSEQSAAESEAAQLRAELAQLRSRESNVLGDDAGDNATLATSLPGMSDDDKAALVEELCSVRRNAQRAEARCTELEANMREAITRVQAADAEVAALRAEATAAKASADVARLELDASTKEAAAQAAAAHAQLVALQQTCDALRETASTPSDAAIAAAARVSKLEAVQSRLLAEIDAQGAEIERLFSELSSLQAEQTCMNDRHSELTSQNGLLRSRLLEMGDSPTPRKGRISFDNGHLTQLQAERDALQAAVSNAVRREESLGRQLAEARLQLSMAQAGAMVGADAPPALSSILASIETRLLRLQTIQ